MFKKLIFFDSFILYLNQILFYINKKFQNYLIVKKESMNEDIEELGNIFEET